MRVGIVFQVGQWLQPVSIGDAHGIRDRLTERNTAEAELRSKISKAIRQTVTADDADAIVEVRAEQRGPLLAALAAEKEDRDLSAQLTELEELLLG
jgi:hypothetical protein